MKLPDARSTAKQRLAELQKCGPFDELFRGYVQALGFTSNDETTEDSSNSGESLFPGSGDFDSNWNVWEEIEDLISEEDLTEILDDLEAFVSQASWIIITDTGKHSENWEQAGSDFCLTRNRHGAGFWDGDWGNGDKLTEISKPFGTFNLNGTRDGNGELKNIYFNH